MNKETKMDPITITVIVGIVCAGLGIGGTLGLQSLGGSDEPAVEVLVKEQEVRLALTDQDIADKLCQKYIDGGEDDSMPDYLACREYNCWRFAEGDGEGTNGAGCEEISNLVNTLAMRDTCSGIEDERDKTACYDLFFRRK